MERAPGRPSFPDWASRAVLETLDDSHSGQRARHGELTTPTAPSSMSASQLVGLAFERGPFRWFTGWRLDQSLWRRWPARKDELVDA